MNVREALVELRKIAFAETRLLIDCPHCGRSGELGSIHVMAVANVGPPQFQAEQRQHDADLHEIAEALSLRWPVSMHDIVKRIGELSPRDVGI